MTNTTTNKENAMLNLIDAPEVTFVISTNMPGCLPSGEAEPFEATYNDAVTALLDEAEFQLDGMEYDDEDEALVSDYGLVESLRGHEGRSDLMSCLMGTNEVSIYLESLHNSFGGRVVLTRITE